MTTTDLLLDVVDRLTIEHIQTTKLDDGTNHYERHDGLIKQLRNAIASDLGGTGSAGKDPRERIPLDADAMLKYEQLETAIGARFKEMCQGIPGLLPEDNLRAWFVAFMNAYRAGDITETGYLDEVRILETWARVVTEKLDPPTPLELFDKDGQPEVCPECGAGWYELILNSGRLNRAVMDREGVVHTFWYEKERRVALTAFCSPGESGALTASFVRCGCCNHVWLGARDIRHLAYDLEHKAEEATA